MVTRCTSLIWILITQVLKYSIFRNGSTTRAPVFVMREQERSFGRNLRFRQVAMVRDLDEVWRLISILDIAATRVGCVAPELSVFGMRRAKRSQIRRQAPVILEFTGTATC